MKIDPEKGVFGWYRAPAGLGMTLGGSWEQGGRSFELRLVFADAGEGGETPVTFPSVKRLAEFLAAHGEAMNDGLCRLEAWGIVDPEGGTAASWPAAGGEARLVYRPAGAGRGAGPPDPWPSPRPSPVPQPPGPGFLRALEKSIQARAALLCQVERLEGEPGWVTQGREAELEAARAEGSEWGRVVAALLGRVVAAAPPTAASAAVLARIAAERAALAAAARDAQLRFGQQPEGGTDLAEEAALREERGVWKSVASALYQAPPAGAAGAPP